MGIGARLYAVLLCLMLLLPGAAFAADDSKSCDSRRATATTIEAVRANYSDWSGRCIALRGIAVGIRLFADRFATLEPTVAFGENVKRSIVIYPADRTRRQPRPTPVEVIGIIESCVDQHAAIEAMQQENPNEIIMLGGYCHTSLETYIWPVSVRVLSRTPISRLTEAEVPADRRGLAEAPPTLIAHIARQLAAAREMVAALQSSDETAFVRLTQPELRDVLNGRGDKSHGDWSRDLMREARAEFAELKPLRRSLAATSPLADHPMRVLVDRLDLAESNESDWPSSVLACWCKTGDCAGRWPVIELDADNQPARPYFCVRTADYMLGPREGTAVRVQVTNATDGFAEPLWPNADNDKHSLGARTLPPSRQLAHPASSS